MYAWESIQCTLDFIEENLDAKQDIKQLAAKAALSPFYYQRLFTKLVKSRSWNILSCGVWQRRVKY